MRQAGEKAVTEPSAPPLDIQIPHFWIEPMPGQNPLELEVRELTAAVRALLEELELQRHPFAPTPAEPNIVTDPNCPEGVILAIQPRKEGETLEDLAKRSCMIKLGEKKP